MTPSIQLKDLEIGDLIEIIRGCYSHWAVYVGEGHIIHKATRGWSSSSQIDTFSSSFGILNDKAIVKKDKIKDVAQGSTVMVNNMYDFIGGIMPLPKEQIAEKANSCLGEVGYNVLTNNCEHFAMLCRYGKTMSNQVQKCKDSAWVAASEIQTMNEFSPADVECLLSSKFLSILVCGTMLLKVADAVRQTMRKASSKCNVRRKKVILN
ncbi:phospholipase A and acyltransferase 1-like [Mercenaria mercenaria]|uniref:phospholipase A and acyltransferase 1-like n=1 Tax=Mercenaria mercenaria TaxID=6596 RepID=UPI00234EE4CA|nr:phospholipase A and acyltransferase 1-like [Mercenaria mercenaria]